MKRWEQEREAGTEHSEERERELKGEDNVHKILTGFGVENPRMGSEVDVLKYAKKNYCFIRDTSVISFED